nr:helix-hairpin-helix domain-containing protein [Micromonospora sp. CB01531]
MLTDNACHFPVADFDGPAAMLDALTYPKAACGSSVPAALELPQSGRGAHVWEYVMVRSWPGGDIMKSVNSSLDTLPKIGAPATRALNNAGYTALRELAGVSRAELAKLHGMGPKALEIIQNALDQHNLSLG